MDFILGIFTGIGLAMFLGHYLNERDKKRQEASRQQHFEAVKSVWASFRISREDMEYLNAAGPPPYLNQLPLLHQLQDAIANENYEEAARLRDLINKK